MVNEFCSYTANPHLFGIFDFITSIPITINYGYTASVLFSIALGIFALYTFLRNKTMLAYSLSTMMASYLLMSLNELVLWTAAPHAVLKVAWHLVFPTEFLFIFSLGLVAYSMMRPAFDEVVVHWHIRVASLAALLTPLSINISSYDPVECNGAEGPLSYIFYGFKFILFCYLIYSFYIAQQEESSKELRRSKIVLSLAVILCFTLFTGVDIFTHLTDIYIFDTTRVLGVVSVVSALLWIMTVTEKKEQEKTYYIEKFGPAQAFILLLLIADGTLLFFRKKSDVAELYAILNYANIAFAAIVFVFLSFQQTQKITLNKLNTKLILLDQQKNQFLSFATHQLKAPLTAMKWGMETLKEMGFSKAEQSQRTAIIDKLYSTTDDLIHTVGDFLDISKIEQGGLVLKKEGFLFAEYVASLAAEFKAAATNKGLDLVIDVPTLNEMVFADKTKLRQVVVNLVDNAIKYTPTGKITVKVEKKGTLLHAMVADTGPGISEEELPKLFSKFTRGAAGSTVNGSGLGLFLAREIMKLHQGELWATSGGIGCGSQFHMTIPIYTSQTVMPEQAPIPEPAAPQPVRALDTSPSVSSQ